MGAPRLLDKKTVNAEAATEQRQKIMEGITLAKKVDAVRTTLNDEQERLESFRRETTAQIQREIDAKINERESLIKGNERLREERFALQAPINLQEERARVREAHLGNEEWQSKLITQQVELLSREADSQVLSDDLHRRITSLEETEKLAERTLSQAEERFNEAADTLESVKRRTTEMEAHAKFIEREVKIREQEASLWNENLSRLRKDLEDKEIDLSNREIALQRRYETFAKAQAYIKSKEK